MEEVDFGAQHRMSKHSTYELCAYAGSFSYCPCLGRFYFHIHRPGLPRWLSGKESACQCRRYRRCRRQRRPRRDGFNPWVRKIPWNRQPAPVFLPGKFHRQRSLVGYSPWGHKESDTTDHTRKTNLRLTNLHPEDYTCSFLGIIPISIPTA